MFVAQTGVYGFSDNTYLIHNGKLIFVAQEAIQKVLKTNKVVILIPIIIGMSKYLNINTV